MNLILAILIVMASFAATMTILYVIFFHVIPFADRLLVRAVYGDDDADAHASKWERRS